MNTSAFPGQTLQPIPANPGPVNDDEFSLLQKIAQNTYNASQGGGGGGSGLNQLTGDVTAGPGTGSQVATIPAGTVTNSKLANMATQTIKGRTTAGTGVPEDLTLAQMLTFLGLALDPNVAYLRSNGVDATGVIGNPFKPYLTAQAAMNAGAVQWDAGVGNFGAVNMDGHAVGGETFLRIRGRGSLTLIGPFTITDAHGILMDVGRQSWKCNGDGLPSAVDTRSTGAIGQAFDFYDVNVIGHIFTNGGAASAINQAGFVGGNVAFYGVCRSQGNIATNGGKGGPGDGVDLGGDGGNGGDVYFFQESIVEGDVDRSGGVGGDDGGAGPGGAGAAGEIEGGQASRITGTITPALDTSAGDTIWGFVVGETFFANTAP